MSDIKCSQSGSKNGFSFGPKSSDIGQHEHFSSKKIDPGRIQHGQRHEAHRKHENTRTHMMTPQAAILGNVNVTTAGPRTQEEGKKHNEEEEDRNRLTLTLQGS